MGEREPAPGRIPQINLARSTTARMWLMSFAGVLVVFQSSLTDSFASLGVAAAALSAAIITEVLICSRAGFSFPLRDGSVVASALILTLLLPNTIHPACAAAGSVFAVAVIKHSFGGLGANWLNPAAGGWLFVRLSWPSAFRRALENSPPVFMPEGPGLAFSQVPGAAQGAASPVWSFLNSTVFFPLGAEVPASYTALFTPADPGIIADRGLVALLAGTLIIAAFQVGRSWASALYLAVFGLLVRIFGALPFGGDWGKGDVLFALLSGGTLAAAFILSGDPATGPKSGPGLLLVTVAAAVLAFFFRYPGGEPYGAFLAVLLLNALVPLIRDLESRRLYEKWRTP